MDPKTPNRFSTENSREVAGIMALGVFTRRANGPGAMVGAAASALAIYFAGKTSLHFFTHGLIGFWTAFCLGYLSSLLWGAIRKD